MFTEVLNKEFLKYFAVYLLITSLPMLFTFYAMFVLKTSYCISLVLFVIQYMLILAWVLLSIKKQYKTFFVIYTVLFIVLGSFLLASAYASTLMLTGNSDYAYLFSTYVKEPLRTEILTQIGYRVILPGFVITHQKNTDKVRLYLSYRHKLFPLSATSYDVFFSKLSFVPEKNKTFALLITPSSTQTLSIPVNPYSQKTEEEISCSIP